MQVTLTASASPAANILVSLASSDTSEIQSAAVSRLAGGTEYVSFTATVVNDSEIDGDQTATTTASIPNWPDAQGVIAVRDNELTNLLVTLPGSAREGNSTLVNAGSVSISGTMSNGLSVTLTSSETTELTVPAFVTIPAGQTSAVFNVTIVDDLEIDGTQPVDVAASASGFSSGSATMNVQDDEAPPVPVNPSPAHLAANVIQTGDLAWSSGAVPGEIITNYVYCGVTPPPGMMDLQGSTVDTNWALQHWRRKPRITGRLLPAKLEWSSAQFGSLRLGEWITLHGRQFLLYNTWGSRSARQSQPRIHSTQL